MPRDGTMRHGQHLPGWAYCPHLVGGFGSCALIESRMCRRTVAPSRVYCSKAQTAAIPDFIAASHRDDIKNCRQDKPEGPPSTLKSPLGIRTSSSSKHSRKLDLLVPVDSA